AVLAGGDGRLLWQTPIADHAFALRGVPGPCGLADLNGDGVLDLVLWHPGDETSGNEPRELRALSGRDGSVLWSAALLSGRNDRLLWPRVAVSDLDRDGVAEVVAAVYREDRQRRGYFAEILALDGRTGRPKWAWSPGSNTQLLPPLLADLDGDGRRSVCVG